MNDLTDAGTLATLLEWDSVAGHLDGVAADGEDLEVSTRLVEDGPHGPLRKGAGAIAQDDDTEQRAIGSPSDPPYETSEHCDHRSA